MRFFEGLLILVNLEMLALEAWPALRRRQAVVRFLAGSGIALTLLHLLFEGYRWQMLPIYALVGALLLPRLKSSQDEDGLSVTGRVLGASVLVVGAALALALPVPRIPQPDGPYTIGTVTYDWIDETRRETYGDAPGGPRELLVQVWYPAASARGLPERWLSGGATVSRAMTEWGHMPRFLLDQAALTRTHAYANTPLADADAPYPVVLYVHGWGSFRNINQDQIETLASHGYVVVSADHTYGALVTLFPDGRVAPNDGSALGNDSSDEGFYRAANALLHTYAADVQFVLDRLAQLNAYDPDERFTGRLDLNRVGLFGHSTGGGAVIQVCATDPRCKAALGQDAWVIPVDEAVVEHSLAQPLALINSAGWNRAENQARQRRIYDGLAGDGYWMTIQDTTHYDFVMVPTFSPLAPALGVIGKLPARRVMALNNDYLLAFFDKYLRGADTPLLAGPSAAYPEVAFEKR